MTFGLPSAFPYHIRATNQRELLILEIDRGTPWGFFDGATQHNVCGGGALLYLSVSHFFELSVGLGEGLNNFVELLSLKILLLFTVEKGCRKINFYGDSMNVISWINGIQ